MEKERSRSEREPELTPGTPLNPEMMVGIHSQRFGYREESIEEDQEYSIEETENQTEN